MNHAPESSPGPIQYIAAKAIIKRDGKILVLRQSAEKEVHGANRYHPPGGIVEPGESLRDALKREVTEEAGLAIKIGNMLSVEEWRVNIRGSDCQFFGIFFACELQGDQDIVLDDDEAIGYAWVGPDELSRVDILEPARSVIAHALGAS